MRNQKNRELKNGPREMNYSTIFRRSANPRFHYSPLKGADENIPLSVVHVNRKPLYLVFCCRLTHLSAQLRPFACGKLRKGCIETGLAFKSLPQNLCKSPPRTSRKGSLCGTNALPLRLSVVRPAKAIKAQRWCNSVDGCGNVDSGNQFRSTHHLAGIRATSLGTLRIRQCSVFVQLPA